MELVYFSDEEKQDFEKKQREVEIGTQFGFLSAHNGLRRGSVHVVIGTAGGGKSTLIRSILRDFLFHPSNQQLEASILLSEETCLEYKSQLAFGLESLEPLKRGVLTSEQENPNWSFDYFLGQQKILSPDLFIYDNMTTSKFYEGAKVSRQAEIFNKIKDFTKVTNCATIVIAHTGANISDGMDRLINMNDIRGAKSIPNMAEFFYILQRFKDETTDHFFPSIRTVKHRGQELIHSMYLLQYDKRFRAYMGDKSINWGQFVEFHKKRQRLVK